MQGQAHRIEDLGAPRMTIGGLGDDLIKRYWRWREKAHSSLKADDLTDIKSPYFNSLNNNGQGAMPSGIRTGTAFGDATETVNRVRTEARVRGSPLVRDDGGIDESTGKEIGSWGIKQNYVQDLPAAQFPPMNYKPYANLLVLDDLVKSLLVGQEPSSTMVKTQMDDFQSRQEQENVSNEDFGKSAGKLIGRLVAASAVFSVSDAVVGGALGKSFTSALAELIPEDVAATVDDRTLLFAALYNGMLEMLQPPH